MTKQIITEILNVKILRNLQSLALHKDQVSEEIGRFFLKPSLAKTRVFTKAGVYMVLSFQSLSYQRFNLYLVLFDRLNTMIYDYSKHFQKCRTVIILIHKSEGNETNNPLW